MKIVGNYFIDSEYFTAKPITVSKPQHNFPIKKLCSRQAPLFTLITPCRCKTFSKLLEISLFALGKGGQLLRELTVTRFVSLQCHLKKLCFSSLIVRQFFITPISSTYP